MAKKAFLDIKGFEGEKILLSIYEVEKGETVEVFSSSPERELIECPEGIKESVLSLPLSLIDIRVLELPFSDIESIKEVLPFELDPIVLGGSDSIVFDAVIIGGSNGKSKVLTAYVKKDILREILRRLKEKGFDPYAVTSLEFSSISGSMESLAEAVLEPKPLNGQMRLEAIIRESENPIINLRGGELAYTGRAERAKKSLRLTGVLSYAILLMLISYLGFSVYILKKEDSALRAEIRKTYQGLFPDDKSSGDELYKMKAKLKELKDKEAIYSGIKPLEALLELSSMALSGIRLTEMTIEREKVIVKGESPSLQEVQALKASLERILIEPSIADTKNLDSKALFTITAKGVKR